VALELGVEPDEIASRLTSLPVAPHRREVSVGQGGATVIDDTYHANPAGAAAALRLLADLVGGSAEQSQVVVTPGMVELGARQDEENARFGEQAARIATHLLVVGQSNAKALIAGWRRVPEGERAQLVRCATREDAVRWVTQNLGSGDVVLYENDLPDSYP
jgi:UDP-N-acetylmuramoyl-tripeptide--D-alanyl-D-alanine ligase